MPIINKNGFNEFIIHTDNLVIQNYENFYKLIDIFFKEVIDKNRKYLVLIILDYNDNFKTLSKAKIINKKSFNEYIDYNLSVLSLKSSDYKDLPVSNIIFKYIEIPIKLERKFTLRWDEIKPSPKIKLEKFGKFDLPCNMEYEKWGTILSKTLDLTIVAYGTGNDKILYFIYKDKVELFKDNIKILTFSDSILPNNTYSICLADFVRTIDNYDYFSLNNEIVLTFKKLPTTYLTTLKKLNKLAKPKIITFDIETLLIDNVHKPYLFSVFDGDKTLSWFSSNADELFKFILKRKYNGYSIYAHNLAKFDVIFIFKSLSKLRKDGFYIKFLIRDEKIIQINIHNRKKNLSLTIKDSYQLIPASLDDLTKQFKCYLSKLIEPVLVGKASILHPEYAMKDFSHYSKDIEQIDDFAIWKDKINKYCINDCKSLYEVLIKFLLRLRSPNLVYENWKIDIIKYPTAASLSFAIYRTCFLVPDKIPLTKGRIYDFIKESFTGGRTDMYKPDAIST
jgi:hypothetical protein